MLINFNKSKKRIMTKRNIVFIKLGFSIFNKTSILAESFNVVVCHSFVLTVFILFLFYFMPFP